MYLEMYLEAIGGDFDDRGLETKINRPYMRAPALSTGFFFFVLS